MWWSLPQERGNADLTAVCRVLALHLGDALQAARLDWGDVGSLTAYCKAGVVVESALAAQLRGAVAGRMAAGGERSAAPDIVVLPVAAILDAEDGGVEDCIVHVECLALA